MRFLLRPTAIHGNACITGMEFARCRPDGAGGAAGSGESVYLPADMVLRSVGYRGVQIPGLPFDDERGVIPNTAGRILRDGAPVPGEYVAGWIKRGPSGVIGTNKKDAAETAAHVIDDAGAGLLTPGEGDLAEVLDARGIPYVDYDGWQAIDRHEQGLGVPHGRPRTKLASWDELLHHGRRG